MFTSSTGDIVTQIIVPMPDKINRTDKHNVYDYFERTIKKAKSTAIEFFPATYGLSKSEWEKLKRWQKWKKDCASNKAEK